MTVQDLRPNSQDTSAFYLGNIYEVLADPNVTRTSAPSPAKPPPFSRPRYAVWVNSLWFLSLVMSLSCALWATSLHQWARRYIRLTQPARCGPEKRARMRAYFFDGVDKMHVPWAVEGLPTLLHLSLFLFFGGLVIFLFNVDQEVFTCVVCWVLLFSTMYGLITLLPLIRHESPYNTPLSLPTWFLYARILYVTYKVLASIRRNRYRRYPNQRYQIQWRFGRWMSGGVEKRAEEMVEEQSSGIDVRILGWTLSALGDDASLETFFDAIPGLFNSKLVNHLERDFPEKLLKTFFGTLNGFLGRTLSSNSVTESVKSRRVIICRDIMDIIPCPYTSLRDDFDSHFRDIGSHFYEEIIPIDRLQAMARWRTNLSHDVSNAARNGIIWRLPRSQERDGRWITLASNACGLEAHHTQGNVAMRGNNMLLATLIDVSRQAIQSHELDELGMLRLVDALVDALSQFDIRHILPRLQHDFCMLWNELVQEARNQGYKTTSRRRTPVNLLRRIHHLYITLHQGTDATPTAFSASTSDFNYFPQLPLPSSYPFCVIPSHHPDSTAPIPVTISHTGSLLIQSTDSPDSSPHHSTSDGSTVSRVEQANFIVEPPSPSDPTTPSENGDSFQVPEATSLALPVHTTLRPTDTSPPGAQQDIPDTSDILSTTSTPAPTPAPAPMPESIPPVLNKSSTSSDADAASTSNPLLPASSVVGFSVPASPPPSCVPPFPNAEFLALFDGTTPFRLTRNTAPLHLRARGLVNTGSMCTANAVLQLLVHSPPLMNLFRRLGDLMGQRGTGGPETGSGATPLVDATMRFFEEFMNEGPPPVQLPLQQAADGKPREGEEVKKEHNAGDSLEPTDIYNAMKEKRQLRNLLVRSYAA